MAQFKVGDRVRLTQRATASLSWLAHYAGINLRVDDLDSFSAKLSADGKPVTWDDDSEFSWVQFSWLEPAPPAPALIALDRTYQTRDGRAVRIYAVDGGGAEPIHGAVQRNDGEWYTLSWEPSGAYFSEGGEDPYDLVEVTPERTIWANVYPGDIASSYATKEDADSVACADRIACIRVTYRAGDGL